MLFKSLIAKHKLLRTDYPKIPYKNYTKIDPFGKHLIEQNIEYLEKVLGISLDHIKPDYFLPPSISNLSQNKPEPKSVLIHPGSSSGGKIRRYPLSKFINIANMLKEDGYRVSFILGPDEEELCLILKQQGFRTLTPKNLLEACNIISQNEIFLGNDSSISHLASALKRKVAVIFGPAIPSLSKPYASETLVIEYDGYLDCKPCFFEGGRMGCEERLCLNIEETKIFKTIKSLEV